MTNENSDISSSATITAQKIIYNMFQKEIRYSKRGRDIESVSKRIVEKMSIGYGEKYFDKKGKLTEKGEETLPSYFKDVTGKDLTHIKRMINTENYIKSTKESQKKQKENQKIIINALGERIATRYHQRTGKQLDNHSAQLLGTYIQLNQLPLYVTDFIADNIINDSCEDCCCVLEDAFKEPSRRNNLRRKIILDHNEVMNELKSEKSKPIKTYTISTILLKEFERPKELATDLKPYLEEFSMFPAEKALELSMKARQINIISDESGFSNFTTQPSLQSDIPEELKKTASMEDPRLEQ